jgi:hypothetical protein
LSLPDQPLWLVISFFAAPDSIGGFDSGSGAVVISSRCRKIPHVNTNVTISDAFIFLVMLLYGGLAECC